MGKHTRYWQDYSRAQARGALRLFVTIAAWAAAVMVLTIAHEQLGRAFPWVIGAAFAGLVASILYLSRHAYRVVCPECNTVYQRFKWHGQCPHCGLKLLQEEP